MDDDATPRRPSWGALAWRAADVAWPGHPTRWRDVPARLEPTLVTTFRLTAAAVVSYLLTLVLTQRRRGSDRCPDSTAGDAGFRVLHAEDGCGPGRRGARRRAHRHVLVELDRADLVESRRSAIAASLLLGKVLRLGDQALETPISAMLILAVADPAIAAEVRVLNTFIGAGVGSGLQRAVSTGHADPLGQRIGARRGGGDRRPPPRRGRVAALRPDHPRPDRRMARRRP